MPPAFLCSKSTCFLLRVFTSVPVPVCLTLWGLSPCRQAVEILQSSRSLRPQLSWVRFSLCLSVEIWLAWRFLIVQRSMVLIFTFCWKRVLQEVLNSPPLYSVTATLCYIRFPGDRKQKFLFIVKILKAPLWLGWIYRCLCVWTLLSFISGFSALL